MSVSGASGWKFAIGTTVLADILSEFVADTYVEVGEIENMGDFGDESAAIVFASLSDSRVRKVKGARDAGTIPLTCGRDPLDAGQLALIAAEKTSFEYNFRITANDAPTEDYDPSVIYFRGPVMSQRISVGSNDSVVRQTFSIGINSPLIIVVAAETP